MITVRYKIEAFDSINSGGLAISREQSSKGTIDKFKELNLPEQNLPGYAKCKLLSIKNEYPLKQFSIPIPLDVLTRKNKSQIYGGEVEIGFSNELCNQSLEALINFISGEVHHLADVPVVKVVDIRFSKELPHYFQGPKYGLDGIHSILGIYNRPLLIAPVKPSVGLITEDFKKLASEAWKGGADIVKDDELYCYSDAVVFYEHIKVLMEEKHKIEDQVGEKKIYICNVLLPFNDIEKRIEVASRLEVDGVMVCPGIQGFGIISYIRNLFDGIIVSHNSGLTALSRVENFGISFPLITKIQRLAGADIVIIPSPEGTFIMDKLDLLSSVRMLTENFEGVFKTLPALSGGKWAGNLNKIFKYIDSKSFAIVSGTGIFCHPYGPRAGAKSIREAIDLIISGGDVWSNINKESDLGKALRTFGKK